MNVFAHLGSALFAHMKEDIFNDKKASASEDEDNSDDASASEW